MSDDEIKEDDGAEETVNPEGEAAEDVLPESTDSEKDKLN